MFRGFKQGKNGKQGEARAYKILSKRFIVNIPSVDVDGCDFSVEIIRDTIQELRNTRKKINTLGIVQAKFFEKKNPVKIAYDYVHDKEGIRTEFFTLIHTDDENQNEVVFFFTALDISTKFNLKVDDKGRSHYIFKLSAKDQYPENRNFSDAQINDIIFEEISRTNEVRNQEFIREILERNLRDEKIEEERDDFHKEIKGKHILDKLYLGLNYYSDFKSMLAWRVIEKIRFNDHIGEHTVYNQFKLKSNNPDIAKFFSAISIAEKVKITDKTFFKNVKDYANKAQNVIDRLRKCNIYEVELRKSAVQIHIETAKLCHCAICEYSRLNFAGIYDQVNSVSPSTSSWDYLNSAWILFSLGLVEECAEPLSKAASLSKQSKHPVPYFISLCNQNTVYYRIVEGQNHNLSEEVLKLNLMAEKKTILKSIGEQTLLRGYQSTIDEKYLFLRESKDRVVSNSTFTQIESMRCSLIECMEFFTKNFVFLTEGFEILFNKYIESCAISYSLKTPYRAHLQSFTEFEVKIAINHCDTSKLLAAFQRNGLSNVAFISDRPSEIPLMIDNFFSTANIKFLKSQIPYVENRTKNHELRRRSIRIFSNICIVMTYVNADYGDAIMQKMTRFVKELDYRMDELHALAHPMIANAKIFTVADLLNLAKVLQSKNDPEGFLLTNCLWALHEKSYTFKKRDKELIKYLTNCILTKADYHLLRPLSKMLTLEDLDVLRTNINSSLAHEFSKDLFYEAAQTQIITKDYSDLNSFVNHMTEIFQKQYLSFMDNINAFTGLNNYKHETLLEVLEIIDYIGKEKFEKSFLELVADVHPVGKWILNLDEYKTDDSFDLNWLLLDFSEKIFNQIATNVNVRSKVKELVRFSKNKSILQVYARYF